MGTEKHPLDLTTQKSFVTIKSYFKDMMGNMAMKTVTLANGFLNLAIKEKGEIRRDKIE